MISILIIGNEILSHQIEDLNMKLMLTELNRASYPIDEVRIVRDEIPVLSGAIRDLSQRSSFVISSGGVGPTHDDLTLAAYGDAFQTDLILHPQLEARMRDWYGDRPMPESALRMAMVPKCTELVDLGPGSWPLIKVRNCFVLPGLPEIFAKKFMNLLGVLPAVPNRLNAEITTRSDETDFAEALTHIQDRFPRVEIGSYPTFDRSDHAARITLKSTERADLVAALGELEQLFVGLASLVHVRRPLQ